MVALQSRGRGCWGRAAFAALIGLMLFALGGGPAAAQIGGNTTTTTSTTMAETHTRVDLPAVNVASFVTQIIGRLNGGTVFDQTFNAAFNDPVVQAGVSAARTAITNAGGPGVIILGPTRTASAVNTASATTQTNVTTGTNTSVTATTTFGPATILIGPNQSVTFFVPAGTTNLNINTHTQTFIDDQFQTTNTTTTSEVYELTGTVQAVGTVHAAAISGAFDMAMRFMRQLSDESDFDGANSATNGSGSALAFAPSGPREDLPPELLAYAKSPVTKAPPGVAAPALPRYRAWAQGYGMWSRTKAQDGVPGNDRNAYGLAGGFGYLVSPNLLVGFGVDQGWQRADLDAVSESSKLDLTQVALHGAFRSGAWVANAAAIYGFGNVDSSHGSGALGGISTASYDLRLWGVVGEVGYRLSFGDVRVVPKVGADWVSVRNDGFTELGGLALVVPAHTADRARVWAGLEAGRRFATGASLVDLSAYGRVVDIVSGDRVLLPVAFAFAPGVPLTVSGASDGDVGAEVGAKAAIAVTRNVRLHAAYDGRFYDGYQAHAASGGVKVRW